MAQLPLWWWYTTQINKTYTQYKHKHTFLKLNAEQEKKIATKIGLLVVSHKYIAYWKEQIWAFSSTNTAQTNSGM